MKQYLLIYEDGKIIQSDEYDNFDDQNSHNGTLRIVDTKIGCVLCGNVWKPIVEAERLSAVIK